MEGQNTRGFITIATGNSMYYQFAKNLVESYRIYTQEPYPFAILCEEENEYTTVFDDVIVLDNPKRNYFDKFELLVHSPYDETIFLDSDCFAYTDLNYFWEYFRNADDFSAGGYNFPIHSEEGLFWEDSIGDYKGKVRWKPAIHGGLFFIRKGKTCEAIYNDCKNIMQHYDEYRWPDYCVDEPVIGLAMAANGCKAIEEEPENYLIPWWSTNLKCDIFTGACSADVMDGPHVVQGRMIHWSVRYCKKPLYRFEVEKLNLMLKYGSCPPLGTAKLSILERILYQYKFRLYGMLTWEFTLRVVRRIGRILKIYKKED